MDDQNKDILSQIEQGILNTLNSERYKSFLKVQSQFYNYSFNNQMLIYLQRPNATMVAGYKSWEKFERHVMKGEKGISILAPNPYKYEKLVDKIDPVTKEPVRDGQGNILQTKETLTSLSFRKVYVFDIKQTDGKELPSICIELQGNSVNAESVIRAIKQISPVPIVEEVIEDGAKGYYSRSKDLIVLNKGMSNDQTAKTLIHEYAHSQLHNTEAGAMLDRSTKEVQAESVAYIVSDHFGIDTSEYSFDYLASWSSGKELKELKNSFDLIQKTANKIIEGITNVLTKEIELYNSPAKIVVLWSEILQKGQMFDINEANELFTRLDKEQAELMKSNPDIDYTKITAGDQAAYVPYLKTKFQLQLADGRTAEGHFDFGVSGYKDLFDCIKRECHIDIEEYIKFYDAYKVIDPSVKPEAVQTDVSIKNKIIEQYSKEFPAIKHISENTAKIINNMNEQKGQVLTIKDIKSAYKDMGKKLEKGSDKSDMNEFKLLKDVSDDLKQAQLTEKQVKAHEKAMKNQISNSKSLEMVQ